MPSLPAAAPPCPGRSSPRARGDLGIALGLAAMAFAAFVLGGRHVFHGIDVHYLMWRAHGGAWTHEYHTFYLPAVQLCRSLTAPFGGTLYQAAMLVSAGGAAIAVGCAYAAGRLVGQDRASAGFAAVLLACLPAVAFFATLVEVHALALAFCGVAWLAIAAWARDPRPRRGVVVGASLVLAYLAHPSAAPLGAAMAAAITLCRPTGWQRPLLRDGAIAFAILVVGIAAVPPLLRSLGAGTDAGFAFGYFLERSERLGAVGRIARVVWNEWLLGLCPTGFVLLVLAARSRQRIPARAALLATVPFVVIAWLMLADVEVEYGAYTMALGWPAVAVVAAGLRGRSSRALAIAVAILTTLAVIADCEEDPRARGTADAVREQVADRPFLWLVSDRYDVEAWLVEFGDAPVLMLSDLLVGDAATTAAVLPLLEQEIAVHAERGEVIVVTSNAFEFLTGLGPRNDVAAPLLRWLEARVRREAGDEAGVRCYRLEAGG